MRHFRPLLVSALAFCLAFVGVVSARAQYPGFDAPGTGTASGGVDGLAPVNPSIDGGVIPTGATAQVVVLFRNNSGQPVQTGQINLYPSSNVSATVSLNQCDKEPLPGGAECAIAVSVKGLQAGSWRVEMLMLHSGRTRLVTSTMTGSVEAGSDSSDKLASDIETIPSKLDFGALASSQTLVEPVILRNITSNTVTVNEVQINAAGNSGYKVESDCKELQAGQACMAIVTWAPTQRGPATGALIVKHTGPTGVASVSLSGDYAPDAVSQAEVFPNAVPGKGLLVASQEKVDFGTAVSSASTITVSLVNVGDAPLTLEDIKLAGSDNGLSLSAGGCDKGLVLEPIEACPLTLTWSPTRIGSLLDDVQIRHDGARGVLVLPVRGVSDGVVSQDQKAIVISQSQVLVAPTKVIGGNDVTAPEKKDPERPKDEPKPIAPVAAAAPVANSVNAAAALDGLKITSFSAKRAIVNGPGGSRLIYDNEQIMLGGILWDVDIQQNGIEFAAGADRILLLFDRSLSSVNRIQGKSSSQGRETNSDEMVVEKPKPIKPKPLMPAASAADVKDGAADEKPKT